MTFSPACGAVDAFVIVNDDGTPVWPTVLGLARFGETENMTAADAEATPMK
jgi:hypothetical protein